MKEAGEPGAGGEAGGDYPFQDLGDSLEEDNNSEWGRRVVGLLARFVEDNPIRFLQGGRVVAKKEEGRKEGHQNAWGDTMNRFPNRIGETIGPGAEEGEHLRRDRETSSLVSSGQSPKGRRIDGKGAQGRGGKKWYRRAWFISSGDKAPGRLGSEGRGSRLLSFSQPRLSGG